MTAFVSTKAPSAEKWDSVSKNWTNEEAKKDKLN